MAVTGTESVRTDDRRTLHLTFHPDETPLPTPIPVAPALRPPLRRSTAERCLLAAERVLGGWAPTLRLALLLAASVLAVLVLIAVYVGVLPALVTGATVLAAFMSTRGR